MPNGWPAAHGARGTSEVPLPELKYAKVQEYLTRLVPPRPAEMQVMENYAAKVGFPIIGPAAGYLCYQMARLIGARSVFELGSGFGYSTAWFARAVAENGGGEVHHVVWDAKLSQMARGHLANLGYDGIVQYHVAEAVESLRGVPGPVDLIFNDIEKQDYPVSLPVIKDKLRRGGLLIIDNMLWSGRIFESHDHSKATDGVRDFTSQITRNPEWIASLVPVRDGLILAFRT